LSRVIWSAFIFAAVLGGLAAFLMTCRLDSPRRGHHLVSLHCCRNRVASLGGGNGNIIGVVNGVLLIGVINNLLTLAQVPSFYVQALTSAVIIVAGFLTTLASRRSSGMKTRT
jgi:ribose/xylose/arabinose/galactoside ABC-type transport system permease subunit